MTRYSPHTSMRLFGLVAMLVTATTWSILSESNAAETKKAPVADGAGAAILRQCSAAYQSFRSYIGTTRVTSRAEFPDQVHISNVEAKVHFVRPGLIRIKTVAVHEGFDYKSHSLIVGNGQDTWHASALELRDLRLAKGKSLREEVDRIQGTALGAAKVIPSLLVPIEWEEGEATHPKKTQFLKHYERSAVLEVPETVNGVLCDRVRCSEEFETLVFWIAKSDHLLRQSELIVSPAQLLKRTLVFRLLCPIRSSRDTETYTIEALNTEISRNLFSP